MLVYVEIQNASDLKRRQMTFDKLNALSNKKQASKDIEILACTLKSFPNQAPTSVVI